jgi:glutamyl-tRNA reductase
MMVRDRLFVEDADVAGMHEKLQARGVYQALILSTCDRTEIHTTQPAGDDTASRIIEALAEHAAMNVAELSGHLYVMTGEEAVRHVFRIAASLDSLIVGEPQVLGQVKAAHRLSRTCGTIGADLETLLQAAYETAKKVRTETGIGEGPVSIAAATVQLARDLHGDLSQCNTLVIGAGDMGMLIASSLRETGVQRLLLTHPNAARIDAQARAFDCHTASYDQLADQLIEADIVLAAMGRRQHVLNADMMNSAIAHRRHKPVLLIDASMPGDIEPAVSRIDDAFVYDLHDLERLAVAGRADREAEAEKAAALVKHGVSRFMRDAAEQTAGPVLSKLHQHFDAIRQQALKDSGQDAEKATRLMMNRLLHGPSEILREIAADDAQSSPSRSTGLRAIEEAIEQLFGLDCRVTDNTKHEKDGK